jgi:hypothetical protein
MHARTLIASLTLILPACATVTPSPAPNELTDSLASPPVEEVATNVTTAKVVCESEVLTASRIPKRTCRTRSEAELERAKAAATTERMSQPGLIGGAFKRTAQ